MVFVFKNGTVVSWGVKRYQMSAYLDTIRLFADKPVSFRVRDEFSYQFGDKTAIEPHDFFDVDCLLHHIKLTVNTEICDLFIYYPLCFKLSHSSVSIIYSRRRTPILDLTDFLFQRYIFTFLCLQQKKYFEGFANFILEKRYWMQTRNVWPSCKKEFNVCKYNDNNLTKHL